MPSWMSTLPIPRGTAARSGHTRCSRTRMSCQQEMRINENQNLFGALEEERLEPGKRLSTRFCLPAAFLQAKGRRVGRRSGRLSARMSGVAAVPALCPATRSEQLSEIAADFGLRWRRWRLTGLSYRPRSCKGTDTRCWDGKVREGAQGSEDGQRQGQGPPHLCIHAFTQST